MSSPLQSIVILPVRSATPIACRPSAAPDEGDPPSVRREPHAMDGIGRRARHEDLSGGEFQLARADDREPFPARGPVRHGGRERQRELRSLDELAGRSACERDLGDDRSRITRKDDREHSLSRDRREVRARQRERRGLPAVEPRREELRGPALPGGRVDDGFPVRREPGAADRAAPERQGPPDRRRRAAASSSRERRGSRRGQHRGDRRDRPARDATCRSRPRPARRKEVRRPVPQAREVPREVPRRRVALLGLLREAAFHDPAQRERKRRSRGRERLGLVADDRRHRLRERSARGKARLPLAIS